MVMGMGPVVLVPVLCSFFPSCIVLPFSLCVDSIILMGNPVDHAILFSQIVSAKLHVRLEDSTNAFLLEVHVAVTMLHLTSTTPPALPFAVVSALQSVWFVYT